MRVVGAISLILLSLAILTIGGAVGYYAYYIRFRLGHSTQGVWEVVLLSLVALLSVFLAAQVFVAAWSFVRNR